MNFSAALLALKDGAKVTRKGWNGKGQFVYLVPADKYPAKTKAAKSVADKDGMVAYQPYFALRTAQGTISTWVPSVNDCLAEDWEVVLASESVKQEPKKGTCTINRDKGVIVIKGNGEDLFKEIVKIFEEVSD